jgi:hypothetical protein
MEKRTKAELLAWIEQHQPVTREKLLGAFEDMDYEQLQGWLSELQRTRKLFEVNHHHRTSRVSARIDDQKEWHPPRDYRRTPALKSLLSCIDESGVLGMSQRLRV